MENLPKNKNKQKYSESERKNQIVKKGIFFIFVNRFVCSFVIANHTTNVILFSMVFSTTKRRKHSKVGHTTMRAYHFRIEANTNQSASLHKIRLLTGSLRNDLTTVLEADRKDNRALKQQNLPTKYIKNYRTWGDVCPFLFG